MRINFVLPRSTNRPMGGYKVVFQYANQLQKNGNDVHIYFSLNANIKSKKFIKQKIKGYINPRVYRKISWFDLEKIHLHFDVSLNEIKKIKNDIIIATHWSTAEAVLESVCEKKFYFIQGYEIFDPCVNADRLNATWRMPMKKIVISKWLYDKAKELGVSSSTILLPNFIDTSEFPILDSEKNEVRDSVSFLWHANPNKQSKMGIQIARRLLKKYPEIKVIMFGVDIPKLRDKRILCFNNASIHDLNMIYRRSIVYFMPSCKEGWGLTGMEAMACGAAVASIDNGGIWEYADNNTAYIVKNDIDKLEEAICNLIEDESLRRTKIKNATNRIKKMTLENETKILFHILEHN